jgi:hypothetical protein
LGKRRGIGAPTGICLLQQSAFIKKTGALKEFAGGALRQKKASGTIYVKLCRGFA